MVWYILDAYNCEIYNEILKNTKHFDDLFLNAPRRFLIISNF
jgi:hypothetical protein